MHTVSGRDKSAEGTTPKDKVINGVDIMHFISLDAHSRADNMLICGDSIAVMAQLSASYAGKIKCAYLDPPYSSGTRNEHYCDVYTPDEYADFIRNILLCVKSFLSDDGVLFFQISVDQSFSSKAILDDIFGGRNFRNQIIVSRNDHKQYRNSISYLTSGYDVILVYTKNQAIKFPPLIEKNPSQIPKGDWAPFYTSTVNNGYRYSLFGITPTSGEWRRDQVWALSAAEHYKNLLQWFSGDYETCSADFDAAYQQYCNANFGADALPMLRLHNGRVEYYIPPCEDKYISDNWTDIDMRGHLTDFEHEVNEQLIERILTWTTQEGDTILDPFLGSGTAAVVATRLHRKWIGIERGDYCKTSTAKRIMREIEVSGNPQWTYHFLKIGESTWNGDISNDLQTKCQSCQSV